MSVKRMIFLALSVILLALFLSACADEQESTELNLLCVPEDDWCQGMKEEFEKEFGITVNYVRMSSGEAVARLEAEREKRH